MSKTYTCPSCHKEFIDIEDKFCRHCGSERQNVNICKECYEICELTDLYCSECGSETTSYDLQQSE